MDNFIIIYLTDLEFYIFSLIKSIQFISKLCAYDYLHKKTNDCTKIFFMKDYPFNPVMEMPSVKNFRKTKKRTNMGKVKRVAPAV